MSRMAMRIRTACSRDAEQIGTLHAASWRYAYQGVLSVEFLADKIVADRLALWSRRLHNEVPGQYVVVAEHEDEIIGFACAYAGSDKCWGTLLDNLHVSHAYQRQGLGRRLMSLIASWCNDVSPSRGLFLWVVETNVQAQKFYERLGGKKVGDDVWFPPGGGEVPRYCYAWSSVRPLLLPQSDQERG